MLNSEIRINFISEYISAYENKIKLLNSEGLFDAAKLFELFAIEVGSLYFGQKLENLNIEKFNYPTVDLISEDKTFYVQVSTVKDIPNKIKYTLEKIKNSDNQNLKDNAVYVLNKKIDSDRKKFFSKKYIEKMDEYADKGLLLYFLETPDIDLLDEELTENFLIDTYLYNDCLGFKIMLDRYVSIPNPSPIMRRKSEDIIVAINLLNEGCYRSTARNIFALLESEHKRCANAFEGYFTKKKEYRKGHERANKIKDLLDKISIEWEQHSWEKINNYYKRIFANNKIENVCFRNGIVHGDYSEDAIDTNAVEVGKLFLLWLNLRLLADSLSILEDGYNSVLSYLTGWAIDQES